MFTPDQCNADYCMEETVVPTVPDIDNSHWFFDYALYIGGAIHLSMSLAMVISYFLVNAGNFVLPDFVYEYMYVNLSMMLNVSLLIICRLRKKDRIPSYSDEPFFGIRSIYHIVRITCTSYSDKICIYWHLGVCGMLSIIIAILWILLLCLSTAYRDR